MNPAFRSITVLAEILPIHTYLEERGLPWPIEDYRKLSVIYDTFLIITITWVDVC